MGSLYGSLLTGSSGLNSQSSALAIISDNITNSNTVGYKAGDASFSTLVTSASSSDYSSGGVSATNKVLINEQGVIQETSSTSDIAIEGNGFLVVNTKSDGSGTNLLTRAGSFTTDKQGNYRNTAGFYLLGWPLDNLGRLPGAPGNLNNVSSSLLQSLTPVNITTISSSANPTTSVKLGMNLNEAQIALQGAGEKISIPSTATENYLLGANDIISYENATTDILNAGDSITMTSSSIGTPSTFTYGGFWMSNSITGTVLGSNSHSQDFTGATNGDSFSITTPDGGTVTFTYTPVSPDTSKMQFNNLDSLATAISQMEGMSSRVDKSAQYLYLGPINATQAWSMTDINGTFVSALFNGTGGPPATVSVAASADRFSSLTGLSNLINATTGLAASIDSSTANVGLSFYATDPLATLTVSATGSATGAGGPTGTPATPLANPNTSTSASILSTLGLNTASPYVAAAAYNPTGASSMSNGVVSPHFIAPVQVFDSLGAQHDIQAGFVKIAPNTWAVEIYSHPVEVTTSNLGGQIAAGTISFNGDGSLKSVSSSLSSPISINWLDQSNASNITFNWGTAGQEFGATGATTVGKTDGLSQLVGAYSNNFVIQDGNLSGTVSSVSFDQNGFVIANFTNGTSRNIYQLPLAQVANANGLLTMSGNAYSATIDSGNISIQAPGTGGVGQIKSSALEQSNVNISNELTNMIIAQKGYQASAKVMKTSSEMLDDLNRAIG